MLAELATRCEQLVEPNRETDAAIALAIGWRQNCGAHWGIGAPHWYLDGKTNRELIGYWEGHPHGTLPHFTASFGAARTISNWLLIHMSDIGADGLPLVELGDDCGNKVFGIGRTLVLSYAAASLRAKAFDQAKLRYTAAATAHLREGRMMSRCAQCGARYPTAPANVLHKCGSCSGGICKPETTNA